MRAAQSATAWGAKGSSVRSALHVRAAAGRPTSPSRAGRARRGGSGAGRGRARSRTTTADRPPTARGRRRGRQEGPARAPRLDREAQPDRPRRPARCGRAARRASRSRTRPGRCTRSTSVRPPPTPGTTGNQHGESESSGESGAKDRARYTHRRQGRPVLDRLDLEISLSPQPCGRTMASGERTTRAAAMAQQAALAREWRRLRRAATFVAVLTSPATFVWLYDSHDWPLSWALLGTVRAGRRLPRPRRRHRAPADPAREPLRGRARARGGRHRLARRRVWSWRTRFRRLFWIGLIVGGSIALLYGLGGTPSDVLDAISAAGDLLPHLRAPAPALLLLQPPDPVRPAAVLRAAPDEGLRAGRRRLGREARATSAARPSRSRR